LGGNDHIYATWTEWGESGNGQRIWFSRSLDNGKNWEKPLILSERIQNEYERDWPNLTVLEEDKIVVMWEGGWRAYRHAQYSEDAGESWSSPVDTFPWLIGENGFVEFVLDSNGTIYAFLAQRLREGVEMDLSGSSEEGLWYSTWDGDKRWQEPILANGLNAMINPKVAIFGGNQIMAVWYAPPTYEIITMFGTIQNAPPTKIVSWPEATAAPIVSLPTQSIVTPTQTEPKSSGGVGINSPGETNQVVQLSSTSGLIIGILSVLVFFGSVIIIKKLIQNKL